MHTMAVVFSLDFNQNVDISVDYVHVDVINSVMMEEHRKEEGKY